MFVQDSNYFPCRHREHRFLDSDNPLGHRHAGEKAILKQQVIRLRQGMVRENVQLSQTDLGLLIPYSSQKVDILESYFSPIEMEIIFICGLEILTTILF